MKRFDPINKILSRFLEIVEPLVAQVKEVKKKNIWKWMFPPKASQTISRETFWKVVSSINIEPIRLMTSLKNKYYSNVTSFST